MNKLFYIIYNSYYKHGQYKNDMPNVTVGGLFIMAFFCVFTFVRDIVLDLFIGESGTFLYIKRTNVEVLFTLLLAGIATYFAFFYRQKNMVIYERYKDNAFLNSRLGKVYGISGLILLFLSPIIFAMLINVLYPPIQ